MLRYAISDGTACAREPGARRKSLEAGLRRWAESGVDFIQLREKSLGAGELFELAQEFVQELRRRGSPARLLVNSRADIALAAGAHGVHLTASAGELTPAQVRSLFVHRQTPPPLVSVSCHNVEEVTRAGRLGADLILFGAVFEKVVQGAVAAPGSGLERLGAAVEAAGRTPVLALGGVTAANTPLCLAQGAAGVAGIRLFHEAMP